VADELDVIRELAEGGMTMLIATHDAGRPMREPTRRGVAWIEERGTSDALRRSETTGKHCE
jgi:ABC-type polar amino acid transport system ATPase subunit